MTHVVAITNATPSRAIVLRGLRGRLRSDATGGSGSFQIGSSRTPTFSLPLDTPTTVGPGGRSLPQFSILAAGLGCHQAARVG